MKIVLVNPPFVEAYGQYKAAAKVGAQPQMPLGIAYIAAVIEQLGHDVILIDSDPEGISTEDILRRVSAVEPEVVGVTATTPIYATACTILERLKARNPDIVTLLGGSHITALPKQTMEECAAIDFGVIGEGELTIVELLRALENSRDFAVIKGLAYRENENCIVNERRPPIQDLDQLPYPARHLLGMRKYLWSVPGKGLIPVTALSTQRGCPFQCIFCGVRTIFPGKVRFREVNAVLDEIEYTIKHHDIDHFMFCDDSLTLNHEKVVQMCEQIQRRNLSFTFEGYTRADTVSKELLAKLKEVGLVRLSFGIESGNEKILKAIKKGTTREQLRDAYQWCKELKIETRGSLMIGHPFETRETVEETIRFANSLDCFQMYINITTPYPGSELFTLAKQGYGNLKLVSENWKDYRRYGNAVMVMNDLSADDLIDLQKRAYHRFYMRPRIIWYNFRRAGIRAAIVNGIAFFKSVIAES